MSDSPCVTRLKKLYERSKSAERRLIDYILKNPGAVRLMTITELAENADVSYATVCRLCSKAGCGGYKEFRSQLPDSVLPGDSALSAGDFDINSAAEERPLSASEICGRICSSAASVINDCMTMADSASLEQASDILLSAKFVYFIGLGTSSVSAHYAYTKLFRVGIRCALDTDSTIFKMKAALMGPGDALFAVSSSGRTRSVLDAAQAAKNNGARVISLCDYAIAPLTKLADARLCTTIRDTNMFLDSEFPLITGQILLIDMIHACCFSRARADARRLFLKTRVTGDSEKVK